MPEQSGETGWEGGRECGRAWGTELERGVMEGVVRGGRGGGGSPILQYNFWRRQSVGGQGVERDEVPDADKRGEEAAPEGICPNARDY